MRGVSRTATRPEAPVARTVGQIQAAHLLQHILEGFDVRERLLQGGPPVGVAHGRVCPCLGPGKQRRGGDVVLRAHKACCQQHGLLPQAQDSLQAFWQRLVAARQRILQSALVR